MKIIITGGAGFIGSAVVKKALSEGHQVINLDSLTYAGNLANVESISLHPNYNFEKIDIRNFNLLLELFNKYQPDSIMHLAAESHVDRSIDSPIKFIETNVLGTFQLLEAARIYWEKNGSPDTFRFHHISTDEVYGSLSLDEKYKFTENTPYDPRSPYSSSKASADHFVRAWHHTYKLPIIITNCSNNYGPYQFPEKLIPLTIVNALAKKPLTIYGDGKNVRDWLFVEDHVDALMLVLQKGKIGSSYNIGGEGEVSNLDLVKKICMILNKTVPLTTGSYEDFITLVKDRPGHDLRYGMDISKIQTELGWKPKVLLDQGLEKTVLWYVNNQSWWKKILFPKGQRFDL